VLSDLRSCGAVDELGGALCIRAGVAVFVVKVDVSFLSSDGGERRVALLAAAAALADAELPRVEISGGNVVRVSDAEAAAAEPSTSTSTSESPFLSGLLLSLPVASTLATHGSTLVFDPDASESELAHSSVTVVVRAGDGALLGVEGGARRSAAGGSSSGANESGGGSESDGKNSSSSSSPSSFSGVIPLATLSQAALMGRARAAEASEALAAALEAKRKVKT